MWLIQSLKMACARPYAWFLNFLSNGEGLHSFSRTKVFPKLSKISVACPKSVKGTIRVNCYLSKDCKRHLSKDCRCRRPKIIDFELLKVDKMTSLKIYIFTVTEKLETSNLDSRKNLKFKPHSKGSISLRR